MSHSLGRFSKINGEIQDRIDHTLPVITPPIIPVRRDIQETNNVTRCVRTLVRQRMFGNLVNLSRKNNLPDQNLRSSLNTTMFRKYNPHSLNQISIIDDKARRQQQRIIRQASNKIGQLVSHRHLIRSLQKEKNLLMHKQKLNYSFPKKLHATQQSIDNMQNPQEHKPSFISAIEDDSHSKNNLKIPAQEIKFDILKQHPIPVDQIVKKFRKPSFYQTGSPSSLNSPKKDKQAYREMIFSQTWSIISSTHIQTKDKIVKVQPYFNTTNRKVVSILTFANSLLHRRAFYKDAFYKFMNLLDQDLFGKLVSFFDIKYQDGLSRKQYQAELEKLEMKHDRSWAFFIFRHWDADHNGYIDTNDLFNFFEITDHEKNFEIKSQDSWDAACKQPYWDPHYIQSITQYRKKFRKAIEAELNVLNQLIIRKKSKVDQRELSLLRNNNKTEEINYQIKYLEQALLHQHNIKESDVAIFLASQSTNRNSSNASALFLGDDFAVKFSSCYRNSYMATEHNEQTRHHHERIQRLKDFMKQKKAKELQFFKNGSITYEQFLERGYYKEMKKTILRFLGWRPQGVNV